MARARVSSEEPDYHDEFVSQAENGGARDDHGPNVSPGVSRDRLVSGEQASAREVGLPSCGLSGEQAVALVALVLYRMSPPRPDPGDGGMMLQRLKDLLTGSVDRDGVAQPAPAHEVPPEVAVAALLLESAHADDTLHVLEQATIAQGLRKQFGLDAAGVEDVLVRAERARHDSVALHDFTRVIVREYTEAQRLAIAEIVWRVVLADGELTTDESILARRFGNLLDLRPEDVSVAIRRARGR